MERDNGNFQEENPVTYIVKRFERMLASDELYFFDVDEFEDLVDFYTDNNKYDKALKAINTALSQHPHSGSLLISCAQIHLAIHRPQEALRFLSLAEGYEPFNAELYPTKANIYSQLRQPEKAIDCYQKALKYVEEREREDILMNIAFEYENIDRHDQAILHLKEVLEKNPENETALYEIGFCLDVSNRIDEGVAYFLNFTDQHPYSHIGWYNLGITYGKLKLFEKAINCYELAIAIKEDFSSAYFNKAHCLSNLERQYDAIACFKETMEYEDEDALTFYYIGECYEKLEEFPQAIDYYNRAIALDDFCADAWIGLGVAYNEQGQLHKSLAHIQRALELESNNGEYWYIFGDVQAKMGFLEAALEAYEKVLEFDEENEDIHTDLAWLYDQLNLESDALLAFQEGLEKFPGNARLLYNFTAFLLKSGQQEKALFNLDYALSINFDEHYLLFEVFEDAKLNLKVLELIDYHKK